MDITAISAIGDDDIFPADEACDAIGLSPRTGRTERQTGRMKSFHIGRKVYVTGAMLKAYVRDRIAEGDRREIEKPAAEQTEMAAA